MGSISKTVKRICVEKEHRNVFILMEPGGGSLIASAGITLYRVGNVKEIRGSKKIYFN